MEKVMLLDLVCKCCRGDWVASAFLLENKNLEVFFDGTK